MVVPSSSLVALVALATGCRSGSGSAESAVPAPREVTAFSAGVPIARLTAARPCRATIDGQDLQVGVQPLVAQVGEVRWTGDVDTNGTTIKRDGTPVARVVSTGSPQGPLSVFDPQGIALIRVAPTATADSASISGGDGAVMRTAKRQAQAIAIGNVTVTGTDDLALAALLASPEVPREARGLAGCNRLMGADSL